MATDDDAEWKIEKHGPAEYLVRSVFTNTFGPVDATGEVDAMIEPYGMWLENCETHVSGATTFSSLDSASLLDACKRLTVLEQLCIPVNKTVNELLTDYWSSIAGQLRQRIERDGASALAPDIGGPKRRIPVTDSETIELGEF